MPKLFQPFFTSKKKSGLGLGLAICDRIIKNHGGRIEVASQVGRGTTFSHLFAFGSLDHKMQWQC
jgi:two-component system sensor histidine kinase HydH